MTYQPSRRSVLRGAAWSAPVVVMATAAPALAASPRVGALTFSRGQSYYEPYHQLGSDSSAVLFQGAQVMATGPALEANSLRASITSSDPATHRYGEPPGNGWVSVGDTSNGLATYTWLYTQAVPTGQSPSFRSTAWSVDYSAVPDPTSKVRFEAPGYEPAEDVFTPPSN